MANNKYCGNVSDYAPVSEDQSRVVIMYGMKEDGDKAEWYQLDFYKKQGKPSFEQVKAAIIADIKASIPSSCPCTPIVSAKTIIVTNNFFIVSLFCIF